MDKLRDPGEMVTPVPVATDSSGTPIEISEWLRELELEQYTSAFRENAIDSKILPTLTADDLRDIGVTLIGHRRRLLNAIAALAAETPCS